MRSFSLQLCLLVALFACMAAVSQGATSGRCSCLCGSSLAVAGTFDVPSCDASDLSCTQTACKTKYPKACAANVGAQCVRNTVASTSSVTSTTPTTSKPAPGALQPMPAPAAATTTAGTPQKSTASSAPLYVTQYSQPSCQSAVVSTLTRLPGACISLNGGTYYVKVD